jgi:hypothetical protein
MSSIRPTSSNSTIYTQLLDSIDSNITHLDKDHERLIFNAVEYFVKKYSSETALNIKLIGLCDTLRDMVKNGTEHDDGSAEKLQGIVGEVRKLL